MIWVTGASGMLGSELVFLLNEHKINYIGTGSEIDITESESLETFYINKLKEKSIEYIVNCAAWTAVDLAEDKKEQAMKINCLGTENLAKLCNKYQIKLIHISTDYVFGGTHTFPISENTEKNPLGVYGLSKSLGEDKIISILKEYCILRTSWLYGFNGKNFVYTMIKAMNTRDSVKVVNDQKGSPTNCRTLAEIILKIITEKKFITGIYHVTDEGETTWYYFCKEIYKHGKKYNRIKKECEIIPCTSSEYPSKVKRPAYSVLNKSKIQAALNIKLPLWEMSLESFIRDDRFKTENI